MSHYQTYIIKSGKYYKIGKTKNIKRRINSYNTTNPDFKIIRLIDAGVEKILHRLFKDKRHRHEWFLL